MVLISFFQMCLSRCRKLREKCDLDVMWFIEITRSCPDGCNQHIDGAILFSPTFTVALSLVFFLTKSLKSGFRPNSKSSKAATEDARDYDVNSSVLTHIYCRAWDIPHEFRWHQSNIIILPAILNHSKMTVDDHQCQNPLKHPLKMC